MISAEEGRSGRTTPAASAAPKILASCWTWSGPAGPDLGAARSPLPIDERLAAISATGWRAVGFTHADLLWLRGSIGYAALRDRLVDRSIQRVEVEFLTDWWESGPRGAHADRVADELFEAAAELGAPLVKAGAVRSPDDRFGTGPSKDLLVESFARTAERAQTFGLELALESLSGSHLERVSEIVEVVATSASSNAGIVLDLFHMARAAEDVSTLAGLPANVRLLMVELGDAPRLTDGRVGDRCLPGEGDLDMAAFIAGVRGLGWDGWWGVEIISEDLRRLPLRAGLERVREGVLAAFRRADVLHPAPTFEG